MKYFDVFSGIGGFSIGIDSAIPDAECVGYLENDKYAIQIYQKHYPNRINYGDITKINAKDIPDHDLLVAGVPCQAWSISGKRGGFEDSRGALWYDVFRIIKVKKPKIALLENVKGILSHDKGKSFELICETLCNIGYIIDFAILNSKYFGVPQNRERVFIFAIREDLLDKTQII